MDGLKAAYFMNSAGRNVEKHFIIYIIKQDIQIQEQLDMYLKMD